MGGSPPSPQSLPEALGYALVALARQTLLAHFNRHIPEVQAAAVEHAAADPALKQHCGVFVTLKKGGRLRGCIGSLDGREPLVDGVRSNALNAALHDPRFAPLGSDELEQVSIEVSVLTSPKALEYDDAADLVSKLRPGVDGVTIRKAYLGATFLPQVWEQLPDAKDFLSHLCLKAGLPSTAWQNGDLDVETYQVQYFEEPH